VKRHVGALIHFEFFFGEALKRRGHLTRLSE
jgi:hypothetical protein